MPFLPAQDSSCMRKEPGPICQYEAGTGACAWGCAWYCEGGCAAADWGPDVFALSEDFGPESPKDAPWAAPYATVCPAMEAGEAAEAEPALANETAEAEEEGLAEVFEGHPVQDLLRPDQLRAVCRD